jgi:RNA recognition motif-containing protein
MAPGGHSSVFFGNIAYDCEVEELNRTLRTCGPFRDMKLMFGEDNKPKGFGFCTYNDPDTASSAIRNLNKLAINNRDLKVHYASDERSGTNLKKEEVHDRDAAEIISLAGNTSHTQIDNGEMLRPQTSTVDEMLRSLSEAQKEMLIFGI